MKSEELRRPGGLDKFRATDREECGVLIENKDGFVYVVRVPNRAESDDDYVILVEDVAKVQDVLIPGEENIIGFFHTHLPHHKCEPTDADFEGAAQFPDLHNLIYKPDTEELCWYGPEIDEVETEKT